MNQMTPSRTHLTDKQKQVLNDSEEDEEFWFNSVILNILNFCTINRTEFGGREQCKLYFQKVPLRSFTHLPSMALSTAGGNATFVIGPWSWSKLQMLTSHCMLFGAVQAALRPHIPCQTVFATVLVLRHFTPCSYALSVVLTRAPHAIWSTTQRDVLKRHTLTYSEKLEVTTSEKRCNHFLSCQELLRWMRHILEQLNSTAQKRWIQWSAGSSAFSADQPRCHFSIT